MVYTPQPVNFDGTNDWLLRGGALSGASDVVSGTISAWFRLSVAGQGTQRSIINSQASRIRLVYFATNAGEIRFRDASSVSTIAANLPTVTNTNWHHVILTTNGTSGQCFFDGQSGTLSASPTNVAIDWTLTDFSIGATITGAEVYSGDLADVWAEDAYVGDLNTPANLAKFIQSNGFPADLGLDGSTPTGSSPLMFFSGATNAWHTNKGTGGGFNLTGALTDGTVPLPGGPRFILTRPAP